MTAEAVPGRVNVGEYAGKEFLLNLDRAERAEFYKLLDEAPWEGKTASGHWQVRDLCGHMIDVTESYLERFAGARAGKEAPAALGLPVMAQKLDEGATRFRSLSKADAIARLKTASDKLFVLFDALDEQSLVRRDRAARLHGPAAGLLLRCLPVDRLLDPLVGHQGGPGPRRAAVRRGRGHVDPVHADRHPVHGRRASGRLV